MKNTLSFKLLRALFIILLISQAGYSQSNFWQHANGPYGGDVRAVGISPTGDFFAAVVAVGDFDARISNVEIFRSTDRGSLWFSADAGLAELENSAFVFNSSGHIFTWSRNILYRSIDHAETWQQINTGLGTRDFTAIVITPHDELLAGTQLLQPFVSEVFRSTDNGENWTKTSYAFARALRTFTFNSQGEIFAASSDGTIVKTIDNGENWMMVNDGANIFTLYALTTNAEDDIFAAIHAGILRSRDNGGTWEKLNTGITSPGTRSLAINSTDDIFAATDGGIFKSSDEGDTWAVTAFPELRTNTVVYDSTGDGLYAGGQGVGLFHSTDNGTTWLQTNTGIVKSTVPALLSDADGNAFAGTVNDGLYRSSDSGESWTKVTNGFIQDEDILSLAISPSGEILLGTGNFYGPGGVYRSLDNGDTWTNLNVGNGSDVPFRIVGINSKGHIFTGCRAECIWRSTNNGGTWTGIIFDAKGDFQAIAMNSADHIFVGLADSPGTFGTGISRSTTSGDSWEPVNNGLEVRNVRAIAINSGDVLFAAADVRRDPFFLVGGTLYRSADNGNSWADIGEFLQGEIATAIAINDDEHIYVGTLNDKLHMSKDNGDSWELVSDEMSIAGRAAILELAFTPDGILFAGTSSKGVFRSVSTTVSVQTESLQIPTHVDLAQNYPNPFNPTTVISYQVSALSDVELTIYNQLGQEVIILVNERKPAGSHHIEWDGRDHAGQQVASGVYLYRLEAGSFVETRKMVLLR